MIKKGVLLATLSLCMLAGNAAAYKPMMTTYQRDMICTQNASEVASLYQLQELHASRALMVAVYLRMRMAGHVPNAKLKPLVRDVYHIVARYEKTGRWSGNKAVIPLAKRGLHDIAPVHGTPPKANYYRIAFGHCLLTHP